MPLDMLNRQIQPRHIVTANAHRGLWIGRVERVTQKMAYVLGLLNAEKLTRGEEIHARWYSLQIRDTDRNVILTDWTALPEVLQRAFTILDLPIEEVEQEYRLVELRRRHNLSFTQRAITRRVYNEVRLHVEAVGGIRAWNQGGFMNQPRPPRISDETHSWLVYFAPKHQQHDRTLAVALGLDVNQPFANRVRERTFSFDEYLEAAGIPIAET